MNVDPTSLSSQSHERVNLLSRLIIVYQVYKHAMKLFSDICVEKTTEKGKGEL